MIKRLRDRLHANVRLPLDPSVDLVSKRFLVRLIILIVFAALPISGSVGFVSVRQKVLGVAHLARA